MGRMSRICIETMLKMVNSLIGLIGVAIILYALYMIMDWNRHVDDHHHHLHFHAPWFMYSFLGLGITLCVITCLGHIAAETANGCCLYFYLVFVFLLVMLEAAVTVDILLNSNWERDFPADPSGDFNNFKDFVRKNFEMCKWVGLSAVCVQGLCMLLAMILNALGPHTERCYDSDDDYIPDRVPLLKNYVHPPGGDLYTDPEMTPGISGFKTRYTDKQSGKGIHAYVDKIDGELYTPGGSCCQEDLAESFVGVSTSGENVGT